MKTTVLRLILSSGILFAVQNVAAEGWTNVIVNCGSSLSFATTIRNDLNAVIGQDSVISKGPRVVNGQQTVSFSDGSVSQSINGITVTLKLEGTAYYPRAAGQLTLNLPHSKLTDNTTGIVSVQISGSNSTELNGINESNLICTVATSPAAYL